MSIHNTQLHNDRKVANTATSGGHSGNNIAEEQIDENAANEKRHLDNKKLNLALDGKLDEAGLMETSVKPAANPSDSADKKNKKDKDKDDLALHLMLLNDQVNYWAGQANKYEAQAEAVDKAIENVMAGKDPTDSMTPEEKQNFEDAVQEYKDKYGLTDVDLADPNVLRQIGALAKENEANAQANAAKAKTHHDNITEATTEELRQAAIQSASEADFFVALKTVTELDDDLNASEQIFKLRGYDELSTAETSAAHSSSDSFFSDSDAFDDLDMSENVADTTHSTSVAATYDEKPLFDQEPISAKFQTAALGATDESPKPEQENTLATDGQTMKPIEFNQFPA